MLEVASHSAYKNDDVNRMTRKHLYYNPHVCRKAAEIANASVSQGRSTLILIEELEQFAHILPHLKHEVTYAHGPVTKDNKESIPVEYHKSNVEQLVKDFNDQKSMLMVGTSCVSIGTDLKSASTIIFLQGGISEINVRQCVGRGTRLFPGKKNCHYFDFDVVNVESQHRHAQIRKEIYEDIYGPVKVLKGNLGE
jgi:superfamily II DNA or RNA helicase